MLLLAALSGACSMQPAQAPAEPELVAPVTRPEPPIGEVRSRPLQRIPFPPRLPSIAIVLSGSQSVYTDIATALASRLQQFVVFDLGSDDDPPVSVLRRINDSAAGVVVAVGRRAAQSAVTMSDRPVVFAQVVNYQDLGLVRENSRGVAALPPVDAQFRAWRDLDPDLVRIGTILGPGHEALIDEARLAAETLGIDLQVQVTRSDQETLFYFRRMVRDIDGFWLFPDNRVLSARALQEMLAEASRRQVPVAVPSESMLALGGTVSLAAVADDVAETIVSLIRRIQQGGLTDLPPVTPLSEIRVTTGSASRVVRP